MQLVMKNTIEEQMQSLAESAQEPPSLSHDLFDPTRGDRGSSTTTTCVRDSQEVELLSCFLSI